MTPLHDTPEISNQLRWINALTSRSPAPLDSQLGPEGLIRDLVRWAGRRFPPCARRRMEPEDLVQEALFGAVRVLGDLERIDPGRLLRYLEQSIRNRIRDEIRRSSIGEVTNEVSAFLVAPDPGPYEVTLASNERSVLGCAMLQLTETEQRLVVGRLELLLSYEELALLEGRANAETARSATRRAMAHLAAAIREASRRSSS